ncbi:MAG: ATP-binding protein [Armatimonadetes bacterium]|nr:ATP-binding protein [Armatimonadota bacterium]NOG39763.1 ATP-binding protein [Armatimonadota bacterium]GIK33383.1 MAG: hypothetical protein BroJett009_23750 [Armatimonadota bacterium]
MNPFSAEQLAYLFEVDPDRPRLLKRRESKTLEIKENFNLSNDAKGMYGRSMAAFANREGGYILFGVKDKPHELVGMTNDTFENMDPTQLQQFLAGQLAPGVDWVHCLHQIGNRKFGLIYTSPARCKPVVAIKQGPKDIRDGDIYFRYQGETKRIGSAELHQLIQDRVEIERRGWHAFLKEAATITPATSVVLDTLSGKGATDGRRFVVDEKLLEKIRFIQEGKFTEAGEPTLRVLGDVEVARPEAIIVEHEVAHDQARDFPFLTRDIVARVNERFGAGTITLNDIASVIKKNHDVPTRADWHYRNPVLNSSPQYSQGFLDWLCSQIETIEGFMATERATWRERQRQGA